ncbi:ATP-NAD kinase-like protein [Amylocarpus encephaloides]|uniref:ATP-NAD kinase-like protein n=1 Tax=Amylocarpus encephaloides TaxID=45428 RepID=A0A9P7YQ68_9HELO|nr:ATP-NAD kinase-like protein [Amylocarpus encephaloides]
MSPSNRPSIPLPDREQNDATNPFCSHDEGHSSASDNEYQHALEVVFDPQNAHRRKSSLVASENPIARRNTDCFVHTLLESQRKLGGGSYNKSLEGIAESMGNNSGKEEDCAVDPKYTRSGDGEDDTTSQNDEQSWKQQVATKHIKENAAIAKKFDSIQPHESDEKPINSRLLTKKQLSDMAWGVRELSKRLGSIRLKLKVKTVFLLTKVYDESLIANTREVVKWLLSPEREVRYTVYVENTLKENRKFNAADLIADIEKKYSKMESNGDLKTIDKRLKYWTNEMCRSKPHTFDFVVTLGGDGTVLYASWLFQRIVPPVLSFALGSLGFLTKFDYEQFEDTLTKSFKDGVTISLRLRFEGTVMRSQKKRKQIQDGDKANNEDVDDIDKSRDLVEELVGEEKEDERTHKPDGTYEILNDIVVDRGPNPTMSSTEIFGDDEYFTSVQADGVCVATPTGSTAYNLAAGGSLCHPENPVILVTAICAHTLSFRPIILPDTVVLRVGVPYDARTSSWASFDGRERVELRPGDYVTISASRYPFASVMQRGRRSEDWVNSISGKLGWNTRQKPKSYTEWGK